MKKIDNRTMGGRIREQRIKMGMTQEELAEKMFTTKMTISHYENDQTDIKGSVIMELAGLLETTAGYLLNGEVDMVGMYEQMKEIREAFMRLGNDKIRQIALEQMKVLATLYNIE